MSIPIPNHTESMSVALGEARSALEHNDVPIGAVLVDEEGVVVARDHNRREERGDATAHAEMLVISARSRELGQWRLSGHTLVVTLEPCPMCAMAAVWARIDTIVYAAADLNAGGAWSLFNIPQDERLNHHVEIEAGVLAEESQALLDAFFRSRR
ncbi:MAG: nucleoside deaminase [Acidimicrobiia bacterium]